MRDARARRTHGLDPGDRRRRRDRLLLRDDRRSPSERVRELAALDRRACRRARRGKSSRSTGWWTAISSAYREALRLGLAAAAERRPPRRGAHHDWWDRPMAFTERPPRAGIARRGSANLGRDATPLATDRHARFRRVPSPLTARPGRSAVEVPVVSTDSQATGLFARRLRAAVRRRLQRASRRPNPRNASWWLVNLYLVGPVARRRRDAGRRHARGFPNGRLRSNSIRPRRPIRAARRIVPSRRPAVCGAPTCRDRVAWRCRRPIEALRERKASIGHGGRAPQSKNPRSPICRSTPSCTWPRTIVLFGTLTSRARLRRRRERSRRRSARFTTRRHGRASRSPTARWHVLRKIRKTHAIATYVSLTTQERGKDCDAIAGDQSDLRSARAGTEEPLQSSGTCVPSGHPVQAPRAPAPPVRAPPSVVVASAVKCAILRRFAA